MRRTALDRIQDPEGQQFGYSDGRNPCDRIVNGKPAPLLLTALPDSVLPHLLALSRDADAQMRAAAVAALGALGCAQPVLAPSVVNALVAKFSDPADTVVSEAVDQLAGLRS